MFTATGRLDADEDAAGAAAVRVVVVPGRLAALLVQDSGFRVQRLEFRV
jgi:hypothetical protein